MSSQRNSTADTRSQGLREHAKRNLPSGEDTEEDMPLPQALARWQQRSKPCNVFAAPKKIARAASSKCINLWGNEPVVIDSEQSADLVDLDNDMKKQKQSLPVTPCVQKKQRADTLLSTPNIHRPRLALNNKRMCLKTRATGNFSSRRSDANKVAKKPALQQAPVQLEPETDVQRKAKRLKTEKDNAAAAQEDQKQITQRKKTEEQEPPEKAPQLGDQCDSNDLLDAATISRTKQLPKLLALGDEPVSAANPSSDVWWQCSLCEYSVSSGDKHRSQLKYLHTRKHSSSASAAGASSSNQQETAESEEAAPKELHSEMQKPAEEEEPTHKKDRAQKEAVASSISTYMAIFNEWHSALRESDGDGGSLAFASLAFAISLSSVRPAAPEFGEEDLTCLLPLVYSYVIDEISRRRAQRTQYEADLKRLISSPSSQEDAAFISKYLKKHATEAAKADLRELEAAMKRGVWLSETLLRMKVSLEVNECVAVLRSNIATVSKRVPAVLDQAVQNTKAGLAPCASKGIAVGCWSSPNQLAASLKSCDPPEHVNIKRNAPEALALQELYCNGLSLALRLLADKNTEELVQGQTPSNGIGQGASAAQPTDLCNASCSGLCAPALAAAVAKVLATAAIKIEEARLTSLNASFAELQSKQEVNLAIAGDVVKAEEAVTEQLEGGAGKFEDLRDLLRRVTDKRVCSEALRNLREKVQQDAKDDLVQLKPRLLAMEEKLQRCRGAVAAWVALAKACNPKAEPSAPQLQDSRIPEQPIQSIQPPEGHKKVAQPNQAPPSIEAGTDATGSEAAPVEAENEAAADAAEKPATQKSGRPSAQALRDAKQKKIESKKARAAAAARGRAAAVAARSSTKEAAASAACTQTSISGRLQGSVLAPFGGGKLSPQRQSAATEKN